MLHLFIIVVEIYLFYREIPDLDPVRANEDTVIGFAGEVSFSLHATSMTMSS